MSALLSQDEGEPGSYPADPSITDTATIWQRIEAFIAYRWGERSVTWIVEGPGDWLPPLAPYTVDTVERWTGTDWETTTLDASPFGLCLEADIYRITATVGTTDTPPAMVQEAVTRLSEYLAEEWEGGALANSYSVDLGGSLSYQAERPTNWHGKAIHLSGAADLLRRYRLP